VATAGRKNVTIRGMDELARKLKALPEVVEAAARKSVKAETEEVADDMRMNAPFLTGELRESIGAEFNPKTITGRATATSRHAVFVENGTSDTPAQPFAEPAAERARRRFPDRAKADLKEALRKV
jgi:HK97 gp10 family phage protein